MLRYTRASSVLRIAPKSLNLSHTRAYRGSVQRVLPRTGQNFWLFFINELSTNSALAYVSDCSTASSVRHKITGIAHALLSEETTSLHTRRNYTRRGWLRMFMGEA